MSELAVDGIPVTVACRVLKLARQPYYRWVAEPVTDAEWVEAHRANALFDAHRDDPEFGYRFLVDQARDGGQTMVDRTAWRICSSNGWWSVFGKKKPYSKARKAGVPAHDDHVGRQFVATAPNTLYLADITEHRTAEGKLYLCAIKDCFSNRIVGYSISDRMKSRLAVQALENAAARRGDVAGCILHTDRGSQYLALRYSARLADAGAVASIGTLGDSYDNAQAESLRGLYNLECVRRDGPWRGVDYIELANLNWVHWFNHNRLTLRLDTERRKKQSRTITVRSTSASNRCRENSPVDEPGTVQYRVGGLLALIGQR